MPAAPLVSVIIPVYDPGPYLEKCLESVCGQTLEDLEIVCVDDRSTDTSPEVLQAWAARDPRIRVLSHTQNRGCAATRNTGMAAARGRYIHFMDSDDWIDPGYLEELVTIAERENLPLVMNSQIILEFPDDTHLRFEPGNFGETVGFDTTGYVDYPSNIGNFTYSNCCCLYRRDYLQELGVHFPEGLDYTDNYFHIATFLPQKQIYLTNENAYHYAIHNNSICTKDIQIAEKYDIFYVYKHIYDYYRQTAYIETRKLNFFELSRHLPRFSDKETAFSHLYCLFSQMSADVKRHPLFYSTKEKKFFHDVLRTKRYLYYEYILSPQTSLLSGHLHALRDRVRQDMAFRYETRRRLDNLRRKVRVKIQDGN